MLKENLYLANLVRARAQRVIVIIIAPDVNIQPLAIAYQRANSAFRSGAAWSSPSKPARAQRTQVLPEGPRQGIMVRDPASPGVACFTSVPRGSLLARHWRSK